MILNFLLTRETGFYLLSEKINKSLAVVHEPVPYFNQKLLKSVERTLKRFKPEEPFERTSWEIVDDRNLFFRKCYCSQKECMDPEILTYIYTIRQYCISGED